MEQKFVFGKSCNKETEDVVYAKLLKEQSYSNSGVRNGRIKWRMKEKLVGCSKAEPYRTSTFIWNVD
jgi:hypothetical protein